MTGKILASCLLLAGVGAGQNPPVKQGAGMEAQLMSLGRSGGAIPTLTASVQLTNKSPDHVFVLLMGRPSAVDDAGGVFNETETVSGVAPLVSSSAAVCGLGSDISSITTRLLSGR